MATSLWRDAAIASSAFDARSMRQMIADPISAWHDYMRAPTREALKELIAEDCVFQSPAVHTPQAGSGKTVAYLWAAAQVLGGPEFRYVNEWRGERSAVLEFECLIDGLQTNGVDIVEWDDTGRFTRFKVMIRPIKALTAVMPLMAAALQRGD